MTLSMFKHSILAAALALALPAVAETRICLVVGISDGDTLTARCGAAGAYQRVTVRIAAIDAPEPGQPYGQWAKEALSEVCYRKEAVIDQLDTDRHGRVVADVNCAGQDAGSSQVRVGMAWAYDRYAKDHGHLRPLEEAARAARKGLWRAPDAVPPWEWRSKQREREAAQ